MIGILPITLAVMLLTDAEETVDAAAAAAISEDANRVELSGQKGSANEIKSARITSRTADLDRSAGVVMFEGDVVVRYSNDCTMCADRLYVFLAGTNELNRIVALGNVSITNDTRTGTCAMATFRRKKSEIEMFGDGKDVFARLVERGEDSGALEGSRIRMWLDTEQVEVEQMRAATEQKGGMDLL